MGIRERERERYRELWIPLSGNERREIIGFIVHMFKISQAECLASFTDNVPTERRNIGPTLNSIKM